MQCWKCGAELKHLLLPFSRYEECSVCKADLHACLACLHYAPNLSDACEEDRADFILDKDKANFCDYFRVNTKAYQKQENTATSEARSKLAALFGEELPEADETAEQSPQSDADRALAELKRLFGDEE
tara:strand:- start:2620 stop:3003 length:384 start_codon:yes stop_codon:yes gene_type:complete